MHEMVWAILIFLVIYAIDVIIMTPNKIAFVIVKKGAKDPESPRMLDSVPRQMMAL